MPRRPAGRGAAPPRCSQRHWRCEQRLLRDYLSQRDAVPAPWRDADLASSYTLRVSPSELAALGEQLDALIRPLIAAVACECPEGRRARESRPVRVPTPGGPVAPGGALSVPAFRTLWAAGLISDAGDWLLLVALPIVVFGLTGSPLGTAAAFAAELAPGVVLAPVSGRLADAVDRRALMIAAERAPGAGPAAAAARRRRAWAGDRLRGDRGAGQPGRAVRPGQERAVAVAGGRAPARLGQLPDGPGQRRGAAGGRPAGRAAAGRRKPSRDRRGRRADLRQRRRAHRPGAANAVAGGGGGP